MCLSGRNSLRAPGTKKPKRPLAWPFLSTGWRAFSPGQGAPQESDESCGPLFRSAFPEVLKATTQLGTAESDDGVGALNSPVHSGSFEPCADGYFAPGLYNARGSTQALRMEVRIAHAVSVGLEIVETATRVLGVAH